MARDLVVRIVGDSKSLERAFARSNRSADRFNKNMTTRMSATVRVTRSLTGALTGLGAGFVGLAGAGLLIREAFGEMSQAQKVSAQTAAVLKSTGGAAGVTAAEIEQMSEALMQLSGADDEAVQAGANMLLTFREVRNELGAGNDIFNQATKAALDMSFALGKDMKTSALQLGKALNDPIRGITALRRSGVQFTRAQEKQIKAWVESGQIVRAQKAILREVNQEFGNSARAAGNTLPGKLNILKESLRNLGGTMAENLSPRIKEVVDRLNEWLADPDNQRQAIETISGAVKGMARAFEAAARAVDVFITAYGRIQDLRGAAQDKAGPFGFLLMGPERFAKLIEDTVTNVPWEKHGEKAGAGYTLGFNKALQEHIAIKKQGIKVEAQRRPARSTQTADDAADARALAARRRRAAAELALARIGRARQIFDQRIARQLDRLQDLSLKKQLAGLRRIAQAVRSRMAATTDATRRLNLEDKLLEILRQQRSVQGEIADKIREANQALKDRAEAIKSAVIERLQRKQTDILNRRALEEAKEQLRIARQSGGPAGIEAARRAVSDVELEMRIAKFERAPARLTAGGQFALGGITINVHGVTDPDAVADKVTRIIQRRAGRTAARKRGRS